MLEKVCAIIPARLGSTRLEKKPLQSLLGKPLIWWVYDNVKKTKLFEKVYIATDSGEIQEVCQSFGADVIMTSKTCPSGTDRVWSAYKQLDKKFDLVVNVQGDEPLIKKESFAVLIKMFHSSPSLRMGTLAFEVNEGPEVLDPNLVKVVLKSNSEAQYFSRLPIPFHRQVTPVKYLGHMGLYGYRPDFLRLFCEQGACELEQKESLEQLRALDMNEPVQVSIVSDRPCGVDTIEDLKKVEKILLRDSN